MRTVSVHVMWDTQEKITFRPESICGMPRTASGAFYDDPLEERPFVSPGQKGHGCIGTQAPSQQLSCHFHRPSPILCSQSTGFRHGDSRNTNESILGGYPGHSQ